MYVPERLGVVNLIEEQRVLYSSLSAYKAKTIPALMSYLHGCSGYTPKATSIKGIKANFYPGWPMLMAKQVEKYVPKLETTVLGQLKMIHKGIRPGVKKLRSKHHHAGIQVISTDN